MTTYSLIQYDVLKGVMYFKGTPTPDADSYIKDGGFSNEANQDFIQGISDAGYEVIPTSASAYLLNFLNTSVPEIDLNDSSAVIFNIEIIDDTEAGKVSIISVNTDRTKTYVTKDGSTFPLNIVEQIKPFKKWPTLGKCRNCLKLTFNQDNIFEFEGNLGGQWNSTFGPSSNGFINGQKVYSVSIPDYSGVNPQFTDYIIYWRPLINFTGTDINGNPLVVTGNRWIANPVSQLNTLNNKTFFHVLSGSNAPCPYTSPISTWYNFIGNDGYFLLENPDPITIGGIATKICPDFFHTPLTSSGWNCGDEGCVIAAPGTVATYATIEECLLNCGSGSGNYGFNCTPNGCVSGSALNTGSFATLEECQNCSDCFPECNPIEPTTCSCAPLTNLAINSDFSNGITNWTASPSTFTAGVGGWSFFNQAFGNIQEPFTPSGITNVSLTQAGILQISCSYDVCFQAWSANPTPSASIALGTGNPNSPTVLLAPGSITDVPTAFTLTLNPAYTTDLTFYLGLTDINSTGERIYIDNICVSNSYCPPPTPGSTEDCALTGSADIYEEVEYECICPEGYAPDGNGNCVSTGVTYFSASAGVLYPYPYINNNLVGGPIPGYSILQSSNVPNVNISANSTAGDFPRHIGTGHPQIYYQFNPNGSGNSSIGNPSPIEANPNKWKTQYTFDILKNDFWIESTLNPATGWYERWVTRLVRNTSYGCPLNSQINGNYGGNNSWSGVGTTINTPSPKTYYVGVVCVGTFRIKVNGVDVVCTSPNPLLPNPSNISSNFYPAYFQTAYSRLSQAVYGPISYQNPFYSLNPYITNNVSGAIAPLDANNNLLVPQYNTISSPGTFSANAKFLSGYQLYIYPITVPAGCNEITIENNSDYFKVCEIDHSGLGAIILDNTPTQIANATSLNDLNIVWDTSILPPLLIDVFNQENYLYGYPVDNPPSTPSYVSFCPTGSTEVVNGSPCLGCYSTGSVSTPNLPCGSCLECVNGRLYNGYVVDKGGYTLQGRGLGGIVNIDVVDNPINTWVVPGETEWNDLITTLNGGTAPNTTTGALGTNNVGGQLKDYTRDLIATCWESPNIGAQTEANASGWAGAAGGKRLSTGVYEGLGFEGLWWSANSNPLNTPSLYTRELKHYSSDVFREFKSKNHGLSIRLCRPATAGELNGNFVLDAYVDNSGTVYDGVVIGNYVWITKNLSDGFYNDNSSVVDMLNITNWGNATITSFPYGAVYNDDYNSTNIIVGNYDPFTHQCYDFPEFYVYQKCGTETYLVQNASGSTTTPGEVQRDLNNECWSFVEFTNGNPNLPASSTINYTGNYFSGSNVVYPDCEECQAIHTIYMNFGTKNC